MLRRGRPLLTIFALLLVSSLVLGACTSPAAPQPQAQTEAPAATEQQAAQPSTATTEQATEAPAASEPKVGGRLVIATVAEPLTLDPQKANGNVVISFLGSSLVAKDKDNNYVPWLAKSWEISPDGLVWTFKIRDDVKFWDGSPMVAEDIAYSYKRAMDPETKSPLTGQMLATVDTIEAPDATTLVITLKEPMAPFMDNLAAEGFMTPIKKAAVEEFGENFGHNLMSVGPYKVKEWVTGDHITLERNPDYVWQPAYAHQGPYYIEEIVFRFIPEISTTVAGLEAGELDYTYTFEPQYIPRIEETGKFNILSTSLTGASPYVSINVSKPPFNDLKVRQAINYAINRQDLIDVIQKGNATIQYGPISPSVIGYWPGVEEIGYDNNPEKAKELLAEAGWVDTNGDGIVEKDGKPFKLSFPVVSAVIKDAQMIQEQVKAVGIELTVEQGELATVIGKIVGGESEIGILGGYNWPNYDILWLVYHSKQEGALNLDHVNDPELDKLLDAMRTETDPVKRQEVIDQAQKRIVEQAYLIPLYTPQSLLPLSKKVQGAYQSQKNNLLYLEDAWIEE